MSGEPSTKANSTIFSVTSSLALVTPTHTSTALPLDVTRFQQVWLIVNIGRPRLRRWLTPHVDEVSSHSQKKGFLLLKISVGLLFVPQSGIGVHIGGRKPREIANKNISAFNLCFSNLFVVMR